MSYAYGTKGAPAVGGGLPGLPKRLGGKLGRVKVAESSPGSNWVPLDGKSTWDPRLEVFGLYPSFLNGISKPEDTSFSLSSVMAVTFSPNGKYLATGHASVPRLRVYKIEGEDLIPIPLDDSSLRHAAGTVLSIAFNNRCDTLAINLGLGSSIQPRLELYNFNETLIERFASVSQGSNDSAVSFGLAFSPDDEHVAVSRWSSTLGRRNTLIYKVTGGGASLIYTGSYSGRLKYLPGGEHLLGVDDRVVRVFKREGDTYTASSFSATSLDDDITGLDISRDGRFVAVCSGEYSATSGLAVYQRQGDTYVEYPITRPRNRVYGVGFTHDNSLVIFNQYAPYLQSFADTGEGFQLRGVGEFNTGQSETGAMIVHPTKDEVFPFGSSLPRVYRPSSNPLIPAPMGMTTFIEVGR